MLVDPTPELLAELEARSTQAPRLRAVARANIGDLPAVTQDGTQIRIEANVEPPDEAARARERGAEGIGLFRSEFLLAGSERGRRSTRRRSTRSTARLLEAMAGGRVTVRTFDVSEAQLRAGATASTRRASPLGLRGLRLSLAFDDIFQAQLRALLRAAIARAAAHHVPVRLRRRGAARRARGGRRRRRDTLRARGLDGADVPIGVMIEVPSAALTADLLAAEADFFSIGTNDLIQYSPRGRSHRRPRVGHVRAAAPGDPAHAAPRRARRAAARASRSSVCGEMAADPALLPLLVGLGLREFSMAPAAIPLAKQVRARPAHRRDRAPRQPGAARATARRRRCRANSLRASRLAPRVAGDVTGQSQQGAIVSEMTRVEKPWGYELHWAKTDRYVGKLIHVNAGHALSLQYHNQKDETIFLWSGRTAVRDRGRRQTQL